MHFDLQNMHFDENSSSKIFGQILLQLFVNF